MQKKLFNLGLVIILIGLILLILGLMFNERFFLFNYTTLWKNSKLILIIGIFLSILGAVLTIIGAVIKEEIKNKELQLNVLQNEVYSGICPVCNQKFETTAEFIKGYYVFNCNKCNSKLRVKKSSYFHVG